MIINIGLGMAMVLFGAVFMDAVRLSGMPGSVGLLVAAGLGGLVGALMGLIEKQTKRIPHD